MARREKRAEAMTPAELDLAVQRFRADGGKVIALDWAGKVVGLAEIDAKPAQAAPQPQPQPQPQPKALPAPAVVEQPAPAKCVRPPVAKELRAIRREAGALLARLNAIAPHVREARHA